MYHLSANIVKFLEKMQNYGFKIDVLALPERNSAASAVLAVWVPTVHICSYMWPQWAGQPASLVNNPDKS